MPSQRVIILSNFKKYLSASMCFNGVTGAKSFRRTGGALYLKRDKKNGQVYPSIIESYRTAEGVQRNPVVKSLDYLFDRESKLTAWKNRGKRFFEAKLSDDDVYRALDVMAGARDSR